MGKAWATLKYVIPYSFSPEAKAQKKTKNSLQKLWNAKLRLPTNVEETLLGYRSEFLDDKLILTNASFSPSSPYPDWLDLTVKGS